MKKVIITTISCSVLALIAAMGYNNISSHMVNEIDTEIMSSDDNALAKNLIAEVSSNDYTISVCETNFTTDQLNNSIKVDLNPSFMTSCVTMSELCNAAEYAIDCTVLSVANTLKDGYPYTKYDVEINDVIYGDLQVGNKISIVQIGGYMTIQDEINAYNNSIKFQDISANLRSSTIIEKRVSSNDTPLVGDRYVLFISRDNLFDGAYYPVNEYEGVFKYNETYQTLERSMPEGQPQDLSIIDLNMLKASCIDILNEYTE